MSFKFHSPSKGEGLLWVINLFKVFFPFFALRMSHPDKSRGKCRVVVVFPLNSASPSLSRVLPLDIAQHHSHLRPLNWASSWLCRPIHQAVVFSWTLQVWVHLQLRAPSCLSLPNSLSSHPPQLAPLSPPPYRPLFLFPVFILPKKLALSKAPAHSILGSDHQLFCFLLILLLSSLFLYMSDY